jgi:hypothetical protein
LNTFEINKLTKSNEHSYQSASFSKDGQFVVINEQANNPGTNIYHLNGIDATLGGKQQL